MASGHSAAPRPRRRRAAMPPRGGPGPRACASVALVASGALCVRPRGGRGGAALAGLPPEGAPARGLPPRGRPGAPGPRPAGAGAAPAVGRNRRLQQEGGPQLSSPVQITLNMLKCLLGSGNLALPAAVAAVGCSPKVLVPAVVMSLVFSLLSAYSFLLIARVCSGTGTESYQDAWANTVSERTKWFPAFAILGKTFLACVSILMIIGDCFSIGLAPLNLPQALAGRNELIAIVSLLVLFPLCNLKSLASLVRFSALGMLAAMCTLFVVVYRYLDGSYAVGGSLVHAAVFKPRFEHFAGPAVRTVLTPTAAVLVCTLAYAYTLHYSAPQFWAQLRPDAEGRKESRMAICTFAAFLGSWVYFSCIMGFGFLTFGGGAQGMILNNYAAVDALATPARAALALSVASSFPIVFWNFRDSLLRLIGPPAQKLYGSRPRLVTALILLTMVPTAVVVRDLGVLASLTGAVLSCFLLYAAPGLMALGARGRGQLPGDPRRAGGERLLWRLMVPAGVVICAAGVATSVR